MDVDKLAKLEHMRDRLEDQLDQVLLRLTELDAIADKQGIPASQLIGGQGEHLVAEYLEKQHTLYQELAKVDRLIVEVGGRRAV